jgi:hypothetical protein
MQLQRVNEGRCNRLSAGLHTGPLRRRGAPGQTCQHAQSGIQGAEEAEVAKISHLQSLVARCRNTSVKCGPQLRAFNSYNPSPPMAVAIGGANANAPADMLQRIMPRTHALLQDDELQAASGAA